MKKLILTLVMLLTTLVSNAQWGIVTLDKGSEYVPMNMWYTIHEKDRVNQMYYTSHDSDITFSVLQKVLLDLDILMEDTLGVDDDGSPFWGTDLGNGFYSWIYYTEENNFFTVSILSDEQ